jgi:hypothetical protein
LFNHYLDFKNNSTKEDIEFDRDQVLKNNKILRQSIERYQSQIEDLKEKNSNLEGETNRAIKTTQNILKYSGKILQDQSIDENLKNIGALTSVFLNTIRCRFKVDIYQDNIETDHSSEFDSESDIDQEVSASYARSSSSNSLNQSSSIKAIKNQLKQAKQ